MKLTRRAVTRAVVGGPLLLFAGSLARLESSPGRGGQAAAQTAEPTPSPTPEAAPEDSALGRFLAREEEGLSGDERRRVRRQVAQLEQALKEIRAFALTNDVPPSGAFRAIRTRRTHAR